MSQIGPALDLFGPNWLLIAKARSINISDHFMLQKRMLSSCGQVQSFSSTILLPRCTWYSIRKKRIGKGEMRLALLCWRSKTEKYLVSDCHFSITQFFICRGFNILMEMIYIEIVRTVCNHWRPTPVHQSDWLIWHLCRWTYVIMNCQLCGILNHHCCHLWTVLPATGLITETSYLAHNCTYAPSICTCIS